MILEVLLLLAGSPAAVDIRPGTLLEREIASGEKHEYALPLEAHRFARLAVYQRDIDLEVAVYGQDGSLLTEVNRPGEWHVNESVSLLTEEAAVFRIEVRGLPGGADPGHYGIRLEEVREPLPTDAPRIAAEREEAAADRLAQKRTKESMQQALAAYGSALERWRALGDEPRQAGILYQTGAVRRFLSDPAGALEALNQALDLQKKEEDQAGQAATINQIGLVYGAQGQGEKALAAYQEALALHRVAGPELEAPILNNLGILHYSAGRLREALAAFEQAAEIFHRAGDRWREATALGNLGSVHKALGEPLEAIGFHERALIVALAVKDRGLQADALNNLGLIQNQTGDLNGALERFTQAVSLFHDMGDRRREAIALANLGQLYAELGEGQKALDTFERALALDREAGARPGEGAVLQDLGRAYSKAGRTRDALSSFERSLALRRETGDRPGEVQTLSSLGLHYRENGQPAQALKVLEQALRIATELGDRPNEAAVRQNLGLAQAAVGDTVAALASFFRARELTAAIHDSAGEAAALQETARLEIARGEPGPALTHLEQALAHIESLRGQVAGDRLRTSYFSSWRDAYDLSITALMDLHRRQPDAGHDARAFEVSERARARGLLDLLRQGHVEVRSGADPRLLEQESQLRVELDAKLKRESELLAENAAAERIEEARRESAALLAKQDVLDARIRATSPRYAELTRPAEVRLASIQRLLDMDTALLEIHLAEPRSYLWVVTSSSLASFELPSQEELEAVARRAYEALTSPSPRDAARRRVDLAALSHLLLAPAVEHLEGKRLAVVTSGALQYIPFAALPDPRSGEPLLETHEVVSLPSAAVLAELRRDIVERRPASLDVAVLADPVFQLDDSRLAALGRANGPRPAAVATLAAAVSPDLERSARDVGATRFERLSWTRREAETIAAQAKGHTVLQALDFDASRETATGTALASARIVHFATHGFLDNEAPELSGLVLSLIDREGKPRDGFLRLHDIYNLNLNADLVVLSGCRTALGRDVRGEGLLGLTRGFLYAGSPRVMASLWPVRDRATAELMQRFYHALFHDGLPPAAALRAAQRALRRDVRWRDPYYWAPFVLQGDWRAAPKP
ncbi:MAG TPA: CHAT domain-containing protein [Thermoanaerobaculia bacterium]